MAQTLRATFSRKKIVTKPRPRLYSVLPTKIFMLEDRVQDTTMIELQFILIVLLCVNRCSGTVYKRIRCRHVKHQRTVLYIS